MWVSIWPPIFEIKEEDIDVYRSITKPKETCVVFHWLYNGERCGHAFTIANSKYDLSKDIRGAYELADKFTKMLSDFYAEAYRLDGNENHVGSLTRERTAKKIIKLYKGEQHI